MISRRGGSKMRSVLSVERSNALLKLLTRTTLSPHHRYAELITVLIESEAVAIDR